MNEVLKTILERASLRKYADRPIDPAHRELILKSAWRAPTAGNMMLYSVIEVTDQRIKDTLAETCDHQPFIAKAPMVLVFLADVTRWYDYYEACGVMEWQRSQGKPYEGPDEADFLLACNDAIIAAQNTVIAAESLGIGSCYIGDIMERYETHRELFHLPEYTFPVCMLCYGYYPGGRKPETRWRLDERYILHENRYQRVSPQGLREMLEKSGFKYPEDNRYGAQNFGQYHYSMKMGAPFKREMARSIRAAMKHWRGKKEE